MRKIIALLITLMVIATSIVIPAYAADKAQITVTFNGEPMQFDVPPIILNGTTLVPMRAIFEKLGFEVEWNKEAKQVYGTRNGTRITLFIDSTYVRITNPNGSITDNNDMIQVPPTMIKGTTMIPLRLIAEHADANVDWNESTRTVAIRMGTAFGQLHKVSVSSPKLPDSTRNTRIQVNIDPSIPEKTQTYIQKLVSDIDGPLRKFLGAPIKDGSLTVKYEPGSHITLNQEKTLMTFGTLPQISNGNDQQWDEIFLVNYIHKFLQGGDIPVPGIRYMENLAHSIKELVAEYMSREGIRQVAFKGINYYIAAYPAFQSLKPEIVLNTGSTGNAYASFQSNNFLLDNDTYDKLNAFTIEYAKSIWLRIAYARYLESGSLDFFYQLKEQLVAQNPQTREAFDKLMTSTVQGIEGVPTADWLKKQSLFSGELQHNVTVNAWVVQGDFYNVFGRNNPDYIYPVVMERTPARILDVDTKITVKDESGNTVVSQTVKSGYAGGEKEGVKLPKNKMSPGKYTITAESSVNNTVVRDGQVFYVYQAGPTDDYWLNIADKSDSRNTNVAISYENSISNDTKNYIDKLIRDIDPIIRKIAGSPQQNNTLLIKYDPTGLAGMNGNMTELNLANLPKAGQSSTDSNFDSFFLIEYYHMFHKGVDLTFENNRYTENISQAIKIVVSHYLQQYDIRKTSVQSIPYYVNLNPVLEKLGPGVLVNLGQTNGNAGGQALNIRSQWDGSSKFMMGMNVFTLEYAPTTWLVLADAYYNQSGEYGFFRELQNAISIKKPATVAEFYKLIDTIVNAKIDGKQPSEWLKGTALYQSLPNDDYFIKPLPIQGSTNSIHGMNNPNAIIPFVVSRKGAAAILETDYVISVTDSNGKSVFTQTYTPVPDQAMGIPTPVKLPKLSAGKYKAKLSVQIDGKSLSGEQAFEVTN